MKPLTLVFAGTPAFALPCLDALIQSHHHLKAVYTQPDRPAGRGRKLQASAVKDWAQAHHLPVYQPLNFKDPKAIDELRALEADVLVVIAYGLILPQAILEAPKLGCVNVHASLLPRWRGASPIQHAILFGDKTTGITTMQMDTGMDTGAMLEQVSCPVEPKDTAQDLHDRLSTLAPPLLLSTLDALGEGRAVPQTQPEDGVTYAPKISKNAARIQWHDTAQQIDQQIRAFNPWPIAYTQLQETPIRIHQARVIETPFTAPPGTLLALDKRGLLVSTGQEALLIERLQFPNAKALAVGDWLNANRDVLQVNQSFV